MVETDRVLQPLREEEAAIERLETYETQAELADAVVAVRDAVDRSLRLLLRGDAGVPDEVRLKALSAKDLSRAELIAGLRRRERISLALAGALHELERATTRAVAGDVHPADADLASRVVDGMRLEVRGSAGAPVEQAAQRIVAEPAEAPHAVAAAAPGRRVGPFAVAAVGLLAVAAVVILAVLRPGPSAIERGIEAFAAEDYAEAEAHLEEALRSDSLNVDALLYLGRIYRRDDRFDEAARVLNAAEDVAPEDAGVRRELGYLFMDLGRPSFAARQFDRAREIEPGNERNWIGLIRALRAAGDPEAEVWLERAPPGVRAVLTPAAPRSGSG